MIKQSDVDAAHKKYLTEKLELFKKLDDDNYYERRKAITNAIIEHKHWLRHKREVAEVERQALEKEALAFLDSQTKCGVADDDGIAFSNQVKNFCTKYLLDFDLVFFAANWFNERRQPHQPHYETSGGENATKLDDSKIKLGEIE